MIGWHLHAYTLHLPIIIPNPIKTEIKTAHIPLPIKTHNSQVPHFSNQNIPKQNSPIQYTSKTNKLSAFSLLLKKSLFDEAIASYLDAEEIMLTEYKREMMGYFKALSKDKPLKCITQMLAFAEIEPEDTGIKWLLLATYTKTKQYLKAIETLSLLQNIVTEEELIKIKKLSSEINQLYIAELEQSKDYTVLIEFLEQQIDDNYGEYYYVWKLALLYYDLHQYDESKRHLQELFYNSIYSKKAEDLLAKINKEQEILQAYMYKIPLKREGVHFSILVTINELYTLRLLLDTGATYTLIDSNKVSEVIIIKEDIMLKTAGGVIAARLATTSFKLDDILLQDFKITLVPFEHQGTDGLLGMNFFKRFKFMIDQEEAILYLSPR